MVARRLADRQRAPRLIILTAALPLLALLVSLPMRPGNGFLPAGDNALIEMHVRDIGHHPVLVGIYSRYGWNHPGPALFYLLWLPYQLTRHASFSLIATATLVNLLSIAGIVFIAHRRAGGVAAAWASVVLLLDLRVLGSSSVQNFWNPTISILPFALFLVSAWAVLCGDRWFLPLALGAGSFVVQCHVGFALPVGAISLLVTARAVAKARDHTWWRPLAISIAVVAIMWTPPVIDELTGHPGNLTALVRYARASSGSWGWQEGVNAVLTQLGRLPAWLVGRTPVPQLYASPKLPLWPGLLGLAALAAVTIAAFRRRNTDVIWLVTVVAVAAFTSVVVVKRLEAPTYSYLVDWISSVGVVLWIAVGIGALPAKRRAPRLSGSLALLAAGLAISGTWSVLAAPQFGSDASPDIKRLAAAARAWVEPAHSVNVKFGFDPEFVGTLNTGTGVALQLERHGISAKVDPEWRLPFGASRVVTGSWNGPQLLVGTVDVPPAHGEGLATSGRYALYALTP